MTPDLPPANGHPNNLDLKSVFSRLGLGKLLMAVWFRPVSRIRSSWRHGGPFVERETERQRRKMVAAVPCLPPLPRRLGLPRVTLHLLSGRRFWYQTAFCLHSFAANADVGVDAEIYDDGTFDDELCEQLNRLGPSVRLNAALKIRARLDEFLPESQFPVLRERWRNYPNIRKLIDPHLGSTGWKLVIDSDLLFFRRPTFLLDWLARPERPLHAVDCQESYGYSRPLMEKLAGASIPPLVNVGLCGLLSEGIDWHEIESWCAELITREKTSYYLEQALVAMLAARQTCAIAPAVAYVTFPERPEVLCPQATMHHYVDTAKRWYFREGWRHVVQKT